MYKRRINKKFYLAFLSSLLVIFLVQTWNENKEDTLVFANTLYKVTLQSLYIDGEMSEEVIFKEGLSVPQILREYKQWDLVLQTEKELVFQKHLDDISPLMKANGYFGLSDDGTLSIFNGRPSEADVIQSFFHIDVEMLEVKKHNQLVKGIRIKDKKQYESVLETFKPYML